MPQIKLSALLSDIRGKANGSVFSQNKQGLYFRNNKIGGGKRSPLWDSKKALLPASTQSWRSLSPNKQEAWNNAAVNEFRKNKVGDLKPISGFQFFTELNLKALNIGAQPLTLPPAESSFPAIRDCLLEFPEGFQLVQLSTFTPFKPGESQSIISNQIELAPLALNSSKDMNFFLNLDISPRVYGDPMLEEGIPVNLIHIADDITAGTILSADSFGNLVILCVIKKGETLLNQLVHTLPRISKTTSIPVALSVKVSTFITYTFTIGLDGVVLPASSELPVFTGELYNAYLVFYRWWNDGCSVKPNQHLIVHNNMTEAQVLDSLWGYLPDDYIIAIPGNEVSKSNYIAYFGSLGIVGYSFTQPEGIVFKQNKIPRTLPPRFTLVTDLVDSTDTSFEIFYSSPLSWGRNDYAGNYRSLGIFHPDSSGVVDFSNSLAVALPWIPFGSKINILYNLVDPTTCRVDKPKAPPRKKKIKWKAGSDLSGKVN